MTPARPSLPGVNLWIDPDRTHGVVGETIHIRAEIETDRPLPLPRIEATLLLPDDRPSPLVFTQDPTEPAVFRAEFEPATAGPYCLRATLNSEGKNAAEGSAVLEIDEPREETADAGVDRANLARIATATGGQMLDPARPETWPQDDIGSTRSASQARTLDLWNGGTLLYLLCAMLGIDWLVRLRRGYV
jgi:hypothetical protein